MISKGEPMILLNDISMTYTTSRGEKLEAIRDVSMSVVEGEIVSILGRSGCGKSTLLKVVSGLLRPSRGTVVVSGATVDSPLRNVGFVFQSPLLMPWRTVLDNVLLPIELLGKSKREYRAKAM